MRDAIALALSVAVPWIAGTLWIRAATGRNQQPAAIAIGYGYLTEEDGRWSHGFTAVRRDARGRGVAGAIKRAQIAWAKANGVTALRTANELRLSSMVELNRRLGYVPLYEEIVLRGPLAG